MKQAFLDSNIILRFVLDENNGLHRRSVDLFQSSEQGTLMLLLTPEILAEVIHVLKSFYGYPRADISRAIDKVAFHIGVVLSEKNIMTTALDYFQQTNLDIEDCLLAARAVHSDTPVASFDKDFRKIAGITLLEV